MTAWPYPENEHPMSRKVKAPKPINPGAVQWDWDPRKGPDPDFLSDREKLALERADYEPDDRADRNGPPGSCSRGSRNWLGSSEREQLLLDGAAITGGVRNTEYGEPIDNLTMAGELKDCFHAHMHRPMGPAEKEAIDMVLTKLGRLGRGAIKRDTYMDAAVYMAIAYEVAMIEKDQIEWTQ